MSVKSGDLITLLCEVRYPRSLSKFQQLQASVCVNAMASTENPKCGL